MFTARSWETTDALTRPRATSNQPVPMAGTERCLEELFLIACSEKNKIEYLNSEVDEWCIFEVCPDSEKVYRVANIYD
ncbi:hypothetical protein AVEN_225563-1 [Araneus ventricosus]|uniref:Uncharacterized protein n=1 Tax=Araneus ventricosus TaxID=182803 RepID=A0A4Y2P6D0_ARAVE|nr:hypothetical protein AVEN_225563-1 [Araneus ventricosus]